MPSEEKKKVVDAGLKSLDHCMLHVLLCAVLPLVDHVLALRKVATRSTLPRASSTSSKFHLANSLAN